MKTKSDILKDIDKLGFPDHEVAVTIDDFFENEHYSESCFGVNIYPEQPSKESFYAIFRTLLESKKAEKILVRITDVENPQEWFYSDTVYIIGDVTLAQLNDELKPLSPTEIFEGFMYGKPVNVDGEISQNVFSVWWD